MWKIYGHNQCHYCKLARDLLRSHSLDFTYINIRENASAMKFVKEELKASTVPQITFEGESFYEYIGGYDDLVKHLEKSEEIDPFDSLFD